MVYICKENIPIHIISNRNDLNVEENIKGKDGINEYNNINIKEHFNIKDDDLIGEIVGSNIYFSGGGMNAGLYNYINYNNINNFMIINLIFLYINMIVI